MAKKRTVQLTLVLSANDMSDIEDQAEEAISYVIADRVRDVDFELSYTNDDMMKMFGSKKRFKEARNQLVELVISKLNGHRVDTTDYLDDLVIASVEELNESTEVVNIVNEYAVDFDKVVTRLHQQFCKHEEEENLKEMERLAKLLGYTITKTVAP